MKGPISGFFEADHRRLDALLDRATREADRIDLQAFGEFRGGLLRHIAMEEKRLIPAATQARGGVALAIAPKLRVDHGALAALLVPTPRQEVVALLRSVLRPHNRREEEAGGFYESCDQALGEHAAAALVSSLLKFPAVKLRPYNDGPAVEQHILETLALSRRQWADDK